MRYYRADIRLSTQHDTIRAAFPATDKSFRVYLRLLWAMVKKYRGEFIFGLVAAFVIDIAKVYNETREHVRPVTDLSDAMLAVAITYLEYLGVFVVIQLLFISWRIWREQQTSIETKQTLLDHHFDDIALTERRLRDSNARRLAKLSAQHAQELTRYQRANTVQANAPTASNDATIDPLEWLRKKRQDSLERQRLELDVELAREKLHQLRDSKSKLTTSTDPPPRSTSPRRLTPQHTEPMVRTLCAGLQTIDAPKPPRITIIAIGTERETLDYRNDFVAPFEAAGFAVQTEEWHAGIPEHESFVDGVTILQLSSDATNQVRPIVLRALISAGIVPHETPYPDVKPRNQPSNVVLSFKVLVNTPAAFLVIGQRRLA